MSVKKEKKDYRIFKFYNPLEKRWVYAVAYNLETERLKLEKEFGKAVTKSITDKISMNEINKFYADKKLSKINELKTKIDEFLSEKIEYLQEPKDEFVEQVELGIGVIPNTGYLVLTDESQYRYRNLLHAYKILFLKIQPFKDELYNEYLTLEEKLNSFVCGLGNPHIMNLKK